jgi:DNA polymerase/3'-5' exonuclease PolX
MALTTPIGIAAISALLCRYAGMLRLEQADRFKIKAYRRAADTIELLEPQVGEYLERGGLVRSRCV